MPLSVVKAVLAFYRGREVLELGYALAEGMLIAGQALWFYAGNLLWPLELAVIYPLWEIDARSLAGWGYVAAAGLAPALWRLRERIGRGPLAGSPPSGCRRCCTTAPSRGPRPARRARW